jgi:hypothetical protein
MDAESQDHPSTPLPESESSIDINSVPSTYSGLLDDVMLRYSNDLSEDFFRKMIAKNVLFGGGVFINDGYLVNHPIARQYLVSDGNILRVMLNQGFVRVLTRAKDGDALAQMPETMAKNGIRSYQEFTASSEWPAFKRDFRQIAANVFRTGNARQWPKINMSYGYTKLMGRAFEKTALQLGFRLLNDDDLKFIRETFLNKEPQQGNPRDKFEKSADEVLHERDRYSHDAMREIMDLANQCYHYNFGLAMMGDLRETEGKKAGIAVDTTVGSAFSDLLETQSILPNQLEDIPVLRIPAHFPFHDGHLFLEFLDPASKIGQAKLRYLYELKRLLGPSMHNASDAQIQAVRHDVEEATNEYARRIAEHIADRYYTPSANGMLGSPLALAMGRVQDPVRGLIPPDPVMAIRLLEEAKNYSCDFLFRRFRLKGAAKEADIGQDEIIRVKDIRPQIASLAFDPEQAKEFTKDLPAI